MSARSVVELGELVGRIERLDVECTRSGCRGRYRLARLVELHGAGFDMGQLTTLLTTGCPGTAAFHWSERCDVRFPQLIGLARL